MNTETLQAVSCRIPKETYHDLQELLSFTQKSTAACVKDAIECYIHIIKKDVSLDFNPVKIDQFAYKLNKQKK